MFLVGAWLLVGWRRAWALQAVNGREISGRPTVTSGPLPGWIPRYLPSYGVQSN